LEQSALAAPFAPAFSSKEGYDPNQEEVIERWRSAMDALAAGKLSWEKFLQGKLIAEHPARFLSTSEAGQSLLHLAILSNRVDIVAEILSSFPQLKWRRNSLNWTPLELASFLPHEAILRLLQPSLTATFLEQANVAIPDIGKMGCLPSLEYLPQPRFESQQVFEEIVEKAKKAKTEDAIPPEKIWMGIYFDQEIQDGSHPKVSIRFIDEKVGFGVFAEQRIPSCAYAGEYRGQILERKVKPPREKVHCVRYTTWEMGRRKFIIDAETKGNFTRFINHSSKPNLSLQSVYWRGIPRMIFVALKEIHEGTQLTFDYGTFFWKECSQTPVLFE